MNGMLRDLLGERADAAGGPHLDLADLIARGERRVRHRGRAALSGTVAAVALTVGAGFALAQAGDDRTSPPAGPPTNSPSTVDGSPEPTIESRPLTYGVGATIHWGDRVIEAAEDADGLFVLDEGLVILTGDDGNNADNRLYWTDGSEEVEIARRVRQLAVSPNGSLMAWVDGNDVVIYDADVLDVLARLPVKSGWYVTEVTAIKGAAYWHERTDGSVTTAGRNELVRYDVAMGTRAPASEAEYRAEKRRAEPPVLVIGSAESQEAAEGFTVTDSQLAVETGPQTPGPIFVAATGERLRVSVPDRYNDTTLSIFQWMDDDRFALVSQGGLKGAPTGDLLTCSISAGKCATLASGDKYWLLPGVGGGVGSED